LLIVSLLYCCVLFGDCLDDIECSLLSNAGLLVLPSCVELGALTDRVLEFDVDRIKLVGGTTFMFVFDPRRIDFRFGLCGSGEFEFVFDLMDFTDLAVLLTLMVGEGGRADASSETTESFLDVDEDLAGGGGISVILIIYLPLVVTTTN